MKRVLARHIPTGDLYFLRSEGGVITALTEPKLHQAYMDKPVKVQPYFDLVAYDTFPERAAWANRQEWQILQEESLRELPNFM